MLWGVLKDAVKTERQPIVSTPFKKASWADIKAPEGGFICWLMILEMPLPVSGHMFNTLMCLSLRQLQFELIIHNTPMILYNSRWFWLSFIAQGCAFLFWAKQKKKGKPETQPTFLSLWSVQAGSFALKDVLNIQHKTLQLSTV